MLDPRKGVPCLRDLNMMHTYKLSAFIYREHAGRMVTMFSCYNTWLQFDGAEITRCSIEDVNEITRSHRSKEAAYERERSGG